MLGERWCVSLLVPAAAAIVLSAPAENARWGREGHKIVCEIAWRRLDPEGRQLVSDLRRHDPSETFADSCTWADAVRYTTHRHTRTYHYINVPTGSHGVDMERDCGHTTRRCLPWAIRHYAIALQDRSQTGATRAEALRFLGHFVGDLHQPMHVGRLEDRGGNSIDVELEFASDYVRRNLSLHTVWDITFLCHAGITWPGSVLELDRGITQRQAASWGNFDVLGWTNEAYRLDEEFAYQLPAGGEIDPAYYDRAVEISRIQLQRAGVRLAFLLNAAAAGTLGFPD